MTRKTALLPTVVAEIRTFCMENANPAQAKRYERFLAEVCPKPAPVRGEGAGRHIPPRVPSSSSPSGGFLH
jgi:hypothetical protein